MDRVSNMGMYQDIMQGKSLARVDDAKWRSCIGSAREAIYLKNSPIDGAAVQTLLKGDSLVPTIVSVLSLSCGWSCVHYFRTRFQLNYRPSTSIYSTH